MSCGAASGIEAVEAIAQFAFWGHRGFGIVSFDRDRATHAAFMRPDFGRRHSCELSGTENQDS
jgi:hypothetical protein